MRKIALFLVCLIGCTTPRERHSEIMNDTKEVKRSKIENVERILNHGYETYSVFHVDKDKMVKHVYLRHPTLADNPVKIKLIADVPQGTSMWVDLVYFQKGRIDYIVHMRSPQDIGGGIQGGKHPKQINPID